MKQSNDVSRTAVKQVTSLFEAILAGLPADCAALKTEPQRIGGFSVTLVPCNERSAEFSAVVLESDLYTVDFGKKPTFTYFECPWEIGLPRSAGLDQQLDVLGKMCLAVIAGRCEHRFERRSTRGVIYVSEKEVYKVGDTDPIRLIWPLRDPRTVQYAPYFPGAESHTQSFSRLSL